jgi:HD-GYP domain-containing protein (c-di-GMP phosphodiesterase class II)
VAKEHHERLDGSGYHKLLGEHITPYSRLICIADVFDALISRRIYKEPWDVSNVIDYLKKNDNHFDSVIVDCLVSALNDVLVIYK